MSVQPLELWQCWQTAWRTWLWSCFSASWGIKASSFTWVHVTKSIKLLWHREVLTHSTYTVYHILALKCSLELSVHFFPYAKPSLESTVPHSEACPSAYDKKIYKVTAQCWPCTLFSAMFRILYLLSTKRHFCIAGLTCQGADNSNKCWSNHLQRQYLEKHKVASEHKFQSTFL